MRGQLAVLKGAIFSLHDVLVTKGTINAPLFEETLRLLRYLKARGVEPVFIGNHDWTVTSPDTSKPFRTLLEERPGPVSYFIGGPNGKPVTTPPESTHPIRPDKEIGKGSVRERRV